MDLLDMKKKAITNLNRVRNGQSLDLTSVFSLLETLEDYDEGNDTTADLIERMRLATIVFDTCIEETETFEPIGVDLSYLLGAIIKNTIVQWEKYNLPPLQGVLASSFNVNHPVWSFIAIFDEKADEEADDSEFNAVGQQWEESESGWGTRPDGYTLHIDRAALKAFLKAEERKKVKDFEKTGVVPESYSRPSGKPFDVKLSKEVLAALKATKKGNVWGAVSGVIREGENGVLKIGVRDGGWRGQSS